MSLSNEGRKFLSLYRRILTVHRQKLPEQMRTLGDQYARNEFQQHRGAGPEHMIKFINEWTSYLELIGQQKGDEIGMDLAPSQVATLQPEQKEKLEELKQSAQSKESRDNWFNQ